MSKNTHIVAILDASGSMGHLASEVKSNFNKFLKEQQSLPGKAKLTLVTFDNGYNLVHDKVKLKDVKPLTDEYQIGGMTAMHDAIGRTLSRFMDKKKAIFLIHTDGAENASHEYTGEQVRKMVKDKSEFEFIFVGAGIDANVVGKGMGIMNTMTTTRSADDLSSSYDTFASATMSYRSDTSVSLKDGDVKV